MLENYILEQIRMFWDNFGRTPNIILISTQNLIRLQAEVDFLKKNKPLTEYRSLRIIEVKEKDILNIALMGS